MGPYSDIVATVAPEADRARLLARITTGASVGCLLVGLLTLAAASRRWMWAAIAVASAVVTAANVRWVPRVPPRGLRPPLRVVSGMLAPLAFAMVLFVGATAYLTYATDAARRGGLGAAAGPAIFLLAGAAGLAGLGAGRMAARAGPARLAAGTLAAVGAALALLGARADSLGLVLASAVVFGAGNTVGSAALSIWTAQLAPSQPAAAFTVALVVGSLSSVGTPAVVGALTPTVGLRAILLATAALTVAAAVALDLARPRRR